MYQYYTISYWNWDLRMVSDLTLKNHDEPNIAHSTKKTQSTPASIHISRSLSSM